MCSKADSGQDLLMEFYDYPARGRNRSIFFGFATRNHQHLVIRQWSLRCFRLVPRRPHPHVPLFFRREHDRHGFVVHRRYCSVRLSAGTDFLEPAPASRHDDLSSALRVADRQRRHFGATAL
jgi:hypothetical protein